MTFTLGELPTDQRAFIPAKTEVSSDPLGLKIEDLSEENSRSGDPENGVLVVRVNNGSPAYGKLQNSKSSAQEKKREKLKVSSTGAP